MNQTNEGISKMSRVSLILASILLAVSIFVPIWKIDLDAPQYPEGLGLLIYANRLGGDVEIINGLNHYIGMKTLHAEEFIEFTVLPYIIGAYALLSLLTAILGRKKILYSLLALFVLFGIVAMVDFWRWEYEYGHNLDPNAAIIVPGMAYQPPLIGFKQLLNFGAYSIPDIGGWLFIGSGLLMVLATLIETGTLNRLRQRKSQAALVVLLAVMLPSCGSPGPEPIAIHKDHCDYCKMTIAEDQYACELITEKGRAYKFDDVSCMIEYKKENPNPAIRNFYVSDYLKAGNLMECEKAFFIQGEEISSPMGGGIAAFSDKNSAQQYAVKLNAQSTDWKALSK